MPPVPFLLKWKELSGPLFACSVLFLRGRALGALRK